jgi:hypothetical protein
MVTQQAALLSPTLLTARTNIHQLIEKTIRKITMETILLVVLFARRS